MFLDDRDRRRYSILAPGNAAPCGSWSSLLGWSHFWTYSFLQEKLSLLANGAVDTAWRAVPVDYEAVPVDYEVVPAVVKRKPIPLADKDKNVAGRAITAPDEAVSAACGAVPVDYEAVPAAGASYSSTC